MESAAIRFKEPRKRKKPTRKEFEVLKMFDMMLSMLKDVVIVYAKVELDL